MPGGLPEPGDTPERRGDAPAAAGREVGGDPVQPGPHVVGGPVRPDLAGQAQEGLLEEVLGHLGVAGRADQEREDLLVVGGPRGDDHRVRRRDAMRARGVDRLDRRHHRFHGDETLCPSWRYRAEAWDPKPG